VTPELDRARLRVTWRVVAAGPVLGILGAAAIAAIGGDGAAGLAVLLALVALCAGLAGLLTLVLVLVDEFAGRRPARRRVGIGLALLVVAPVLVTMSLGAAGA
jgi:hypothetical protein